MNALSFDAWLVLAIRYGFAPSRKVGDQHALIRTCRHVVRLFYVPATLNGRTFLTTPVKASYLPFDRGHRTNEPLPAKKCIIDISTRSDGCRAAQCLHNTWKWQKLPQLSGESYGAIESVRTDTKPQCDQDTKRYLQHHNRNHNLHK